MRPTRQHANIAGENRADLGDGAEPGPFRTHPAKHGHAETGCVENAEQEWVEHGMDEGLCNASFRSENQERPSWDNARIDELEPNIEIHVSLPQ